MIGTTKKKKEFYDRFCGKLCRKNYVPIDLSVKNKESLSCQGTVVLGVSARFVSTNLDEVVGSNLGLGSFLLKQLESQEKQRGLFRKNEACRAVSFERRKAP